LLLVSHTQLLLVLVVLVAAQMLKVSTAETLPHLVIHQLVVAVVVLKET
jgi:hypothetical protein